MLISGASLLSLQTYGLPLLGCKLIKVGWDQQVRPGMHASLPAICQWPLYELASALPMSFCVSHHFAKLLIALDCCGNHC